MKINKNEIIDKTKIERKENFEKYYLERYKYILENSKNEKNKNEKL